MASTVQLQDLRQAIRDVGGWRDAAHPDAKLNRLINRSWKSLYGRLARLDGSRYRSVMTFTVAADAITAGAISSNNESATDFWQAVGVEVNDSESPTGYTALQRYQYEQRNDYGSISDVTQMRYEIRNLEIHLWPKAPAACTVRLHYIPVPTALSSDTDTVDGVIGFDDWIVWDCAVRLALDTEQEHRGFAAERKKVEGEIFGNADVDHDGPRQVVDVERGGRWPWWPGRWRD